MIHYYFNKKKHNIILHTLKGPEITYGAKHVKETSVKSDQQMERHDTI